MNLLVEIIRSGWFHLTADVTMCAMSIYLVYKLYTLMTILTNRERYEKFGSVEWYIRLRIFGTAAIGCLASIGLATVTFIHANQQTHPEEMSEVLSDVFFIMILLHTILIVEQSINDRLTKGMK